jgi:nicotinate-nucleotide pyrophosphorylase (carboxylating)
MTRLPDWLKESLKDLEETNAGMLIRLALAEDVGPGDLTTQACVPENSRSQGRFVAKQDLVVAGIELIRHVYYLFRMQARDAQHPNLEVKAPWMYNLEVTPGDPISLDIKAPTGTRVSKGEVIATISGRTRLLLERERVALNFLQHLSGIATLTARFVDAVAGTNVRMLDTRKTTPGWRRLEKMAVAAGGGVNHRMGLWDGVLIKENHVVAAGGIRAAVQAARHCGKSIGVEVRNPDELRQALEAGANRVLLDNMAPAQVRECVEIARRAAQPPEIEVSGGITLANVREYALAGPDFISAGALTHSAPAADISFLLES